MRNFVSLFVLLFFSTYMIAQSAQVEVQSFTKNELSQTAKIANVTDDDGQVCGLIKIKAVDMGDLQFTTGKNGQDRAVEMNRDYDNSVVMLYVTPSTRYLNIVSKRGAFTPFQYLLPEAVQSAMVYDMVLVVSGGTNQIIVKQAVLDENFLHLICTTPNAEVELNNSGEKLMLQNGNLQRSLPYGTYTYLISEPTGKYHSEFGEFTIGSSGNTKLNVTLKPAYGTLVITSSPESGARVFIDNDEKGVTPLTLREVKSGEVDIYLRMADYRQQQVKAVVNDLKNTQVEVVLEPMFAEVTIGCEVTDAEIYVDDSYKGIGRWSGRLLAGNHKVEARKANHVSSQNVFTAKEGETMRWSLDVPVARTGKVQVSTNVLGGEVYVNGTLQGEAPMSD